jgi:hypothetical protein
MINATDERDWRPAQPAQAPNDARRRCGEAKPADAGARRLRACER